MMCRHGPEGTRQLNNLDMISRDNVVDFFTRKSRKRGSGMELSDKRKKRMDNNPALPINGKAFYAKEYYSEEHDHEFLRAYEKRFRGEICIE